MANKEIRTPMREDKRWLSTMFFGGGVLLLAACGIQLNEQTLTFLGLTLGLFMGQSQWGQTKRATSVKPEATNGN